MQTMFHLRLLDAERRVLAWTKVAATAKGDGCLYAVQAFVAECDSDGVATAVHVHWPDVHFYYTVQLPEPFNVVAGQVITVPLEAPLVRLESEPLPVPPVTVLTSVKVGVAMAGTGR